MVNLVIPVTEDINDVNTDNLCALGYALKKEDFKIAFRLLKE